MTTRNLTIESPSVGIWNCPEQDEALRLIEAAGRECRQSQHLATADSAEPFVRARLYDDHHDSLLEHVDITALIVSDRGVHNELVRHRVAAYSAESTRCRGAAPVFIEQTLAPPFEMADLEAYREMIHAAQKNALDAWESLVDAGAPYELARAVLPLSVRTRTVVTTNLREWRHILKLRTSEAAHPMMRYTMGLMLEELRAWLPIFFEDIPEADLAAFRMPSAEE